MTKKIRVVLAQLNLKVGDIDANLEKHIQSAITARDELSADVIVFPELGLTGYPPEDLLLRKKFLAEADNALKKLMTEVTNIYCVVSHPLSATQGLYNACSLIYNGAIMGQYAKQHLPNYGVFDEDRYFIPGNAPCVVSIKGVSVGLVICEDLWFPGPTRQATALGARIILSPNASPFEIDKHDQRMAVLSKRAKLDHTPIVYVNNVGGQDDIVFDGGSMVIDENGFLCQFAGFFNEKLMPVDITVNSTKTEIEHAHFILPSRLEKIYQTLVLAVRDYVEKNNFPGVLIGLSGGIDSALTLAIAVDAIGSNRVHAVFMPSRHTSDMSDKEAHKIADNLGVKCDTISIEPLYNSTLESLAPLIEGQKPNIAEENIQARCRAILLMALSNKFGQLVLTTGNRSEMAVGYCTIYGDMAGGFAVLKDTPKTLVTELCLYRNQINPVIPSQTITRPPTAELAPNQKDEDSLPPYPILDQILEAYLDKSMSLDDIVTQGFDRDIVCKVLNLLYKSEYKRKQSAIGPHINHKSFGKDWRYPITNGFKG